MLLPAGITSWRPRSGLRPRAVLPGQWLIVLTIGCFIVLARPGTPSFGVPRSEASNATGEISEATAQKLADKMANLSSPTPHSAAIWGPVAVTEAEANSYLKYRGREFLPPAVHNPEIHIAADLVSGAADVDFNELGEIGAQSDDWGMRILSFVFRGKQRVLATGKLETGKGQGRLTITSLTVGTTAIPPGFVNFMLQSYMERRYKIDLSKPFALPPHVTHIELGAGRAAFHRSASQNR